MAGYSPERAMREFLRRGGQDQRGLDDLARQVAAKRRELLRSTASTAPSRRSASCSTTRCSRSASSWPATSRWTTATGPSREMQMDNLPTSTAAAVSELSSYDWQSQQAREDYEKIKDLLGREMLDQRFEGMKQALENATDEDRQRINEMLGDLNELLEKHRRGEDTDRTSPTSWTSTATSSPRTRRTSTS